MYNRYVPQQDGTYQKNRIPSSPPPPPPEPVYTHQPHEEPTPSHNKPIGALSFFQQLLPQNLDTGDLLIIILLLLMASDGKEHKNSWLLTLALYLFM